MTHPLILKGDLVLDVATLGELRHLISEISLMNQEFRFPRFGFNNSLIVEERMKQRYVEMFRNGFLKPLDKRNAELLAAISGSTPESQIGGHVVYLTRRINFIKQLIVEDSLDASQTPTSFFHQPIEYNYGKAFSPQVIDKIQELYLQYAAWQNPSDLNSEIFQLQAWLHHLLKIENLSFRWMYGFVDGELTNSVRHITLEDFWGVAGDNISYSQVDVVLSLKGLHAVQALMLEIEKALPDPLIIAEKKFEFMKWYKAAYVSAWEEFIASFSTGKALLADAHSWRRVAEQTASFKGPYISLLYVLANQFRDFYDQHRPHPPWIDLVIGFKLSMDSWDRKNDDRALSVIEKIEKTTGVWPSTVDKNFYAIDEAGNYKKALAALKPIAASRKGAFDVIRQAFENEPSTINSFANAHETVNELKKKLSNDEQNEKLFWGLVQGPINLLFEFASHESSCYLQERWEQDVLIEIQGASNTGQSSLLWGQNGLAVQFLNSTLAPFIQRTLSNGYFPKMTYGLSIPFNQKFIGFLNDGIMELMQSEKTFNLFVEGRPTKVNPDSVSKPHVTVLEFKCKDLKQKMFISDHPKSNTFEWSNQSCGQVDLLIGIGENVLKKTYDGHNGIIDFLNDFNNEEKIYKPDDFPEFKTTLNILNVREIKVHLSFNWQNPILEHYKNLPAQPIKVPRSITACWN
jgi:type VI secretion system protein ImpL